MQPIDQQTTISEPHWHELVTGTSIAIGDAAVLLIGPPGAGKSDLALRLIDEGARLIADDLTELRRQGDGLVALYPAAAAADLRGRMEVRGLGIMPVPATATAQPLRLVVELTAPIDRMPEPAARHYGGIAVPCLHLAAFEASAPAKLRLAVAAAAGHIMAPL
jgi:serine kinase of HPr protein (carbohydrate metabolism regulator)